VVIRTALRAQRQVLAVLAQRKRQHGDPDRIYTQTSTAAPSTHRHAGDKSQFVQLRRSRRERGFAPFSAALAAGNVLADNWATYQRSSLEAGRSPNRSDWKVARQIFLADTSREAVERARTNSVGQNFQYLASLMDSGPGRGFLKRDLEMPDADCDMDFWLSEQIIAGDVDFALTRLLALIEECGPFGTLILMSFDWDDKASWLRNLELFATELMPALNKAVAGAGFRSDVAG
jgi:hypothetical protein